MTSIDVREAIITEMRKSLSTLEAEQVRDRARNDEQEKKRLKEAKRARKEGKRELKEAAQVFRGFGMSKEEAKLAARGREFRG